MLILLAVAWADPFEWLPDLDPELLTSVEEVSFTVVTRTDGDEVRRSWTYRPHIPELVLDDELTFTPGRPGTPAEERADRLWTADFFRAVPLLHATWAHHTGQATFVDGGEVPLPGDEDVLARKITLLYAPSCGGYTPGDAHDLYVDGDRLRAWAYRPGNAAEPAQVMSFERYRSFGLLELSTRQISLDGRSIITLGGLSATRR